MYKAAVRAMIRSKIRRLNDGDHTPLLMMASDDFALSFPGDNSWATMFRPQQKGRHGFVTHRGIDEATAFAERFVERGIRFEIEDILVNGPPWNTRIALRVHDYIAGSDGGPDEYSNRAIAFLTVRWGRLTSWEDYEDTERVAAWDAAHEASAGAGR